MKLFKGSKFIIVALILVMSLTVLAACGKDEASNQSQEQGKNEENKGLTGKIEIDGSSTVYPITEAIAEEFQLQYPDVRVTIGVSGTGGGFKRFTVGETDISNASRLIKDKEDKKAKENGIEYTKVDVAYDGITVVVNPQNDWANDLTVEELKKIWEPNSSVKTWKDVRPEWPDEEIHLFGPGTDSGTFDYFTEEIVGEGGASRTDYTASEDDNVLVQGVAGDKYALGYFGFAYYEENQDKLKAVSINGVKPSLETIGSGEYAPLARPIFIYVSHNSFKDKPQVAEFVKFYLNNAKEIVPSTGYIPLPEDKYEAQLNQIIEASK